MPPGKDLAGALGVTAEPGLGPPATGEDAEVRIRAEARLVGRRQPESPAPGEHAATLGETGDGIGEVLQHRLARDALRDAVAQGQRFGVGADGREICKNLKNSDETQHIPVILFSAHYDLVNNIKECMANGLVTKPFETAYLLDTIRKNIN